MLEVNDRQLEPVEARTGRLMDRYCYNYTCAGYYEHREIVKVDSSGLGEGEFHDEFDGNPWAFQMYPRVEWVCVNCGYQRISMSYERRSCIKQTPERVMSLEELYTCEGAWVKEMVDEMIERYAITWHRSIEIRKEIEPKYCDVVVERWQNLTGKKARRKK